MNLPRQQFISIRLPGRTDTGRHNRHIEQAVWLELLQAIKSELTFKLEKSRRILDHILPDFQIIPVDFVGLWIRPTEILTGIPNYLHRLQNQEVVLGKPGEIMDIFHVQHEADFAVFIECTVVIIQCDGTDHHSCRVNGL